MMRLLRDRAGQGARVTNAELFFDLAYAFAVTQTSHTLLHNLTLLGAVQTLVLWFAVWLGWQYTSWVTNWFDPDGAPIRSVLFAVMLLALVMAAALPEAFAGGGLVFAVCYAAMQVGRSLAIVLLLGGDQALSRNYQRILGWESIAAAFWIAGGLAGPHTRLALWIVAVACEYISPMIGFRLPGLGRSVTSDWTIDGGHISERCQLFVMVALGEAVLVTGATLADSAHLSAGVMAGFVLSFIGSLAMWWIYFDTTSEAGTEAIRESDDPGRIGAYFHYVHVVVIGGIIVAAVGNDLSIAHPDAPAGQAAIAVLIGGPALYMFGNALYKRVVYGRFPLSHLVGLAAFALLWLPTLRTDQLMAAALAKIVLVAVAVWEAWSRRGL